MNKRQLAGLFVALMTHSRTDRGMRLTELRTRCICAGDIHEIVSTDQSDAVLGDQIDRVGYLGFAEFAAGGVMEVGDPVRIAGTLIGQVLGFDDTHFPNHYNILIATDRLLTSQDIHVDVESPITFG
mgnify:CR=1 FL=1|jgi:hypothetical protein|tara:strand:- start:203 stop:583 length:381 start_codon:yes stop_codon:yes gene_type:complete